MIKDFGALRNNSFFKAEGVFISDLEDEYEEQCQQQQ